MYEELMEEVVESDNVRQALKAVMRNRGAAGIDKMKTTQLESHLEKHWESIRSKLLGGDLRTESGEAGGDRQAHGRGTTVRDSDGTGSIDPATTVAGTESDL